MTKTLKTDRTWLHNAAHHRQMVDMARMNDIFPLCCSEETGPRRFRPTAARATREARVRVRVRACRKKRNSPTRSLGRFLSYHSHQLMTLNAMNLVLKSKTWLPLLHGNTISALPTWVARTAPATAAPKATPHGPMIAAWEAKMPSSPLKSIEPKNQRKRENHLEQTSMTLGSNCQFSTKHDTCIDASCIECIDASCIDASAMLVAFVLASFSRHVDLRTAQGKNRHWSFPVTVRLFELCKAVNELLKQHPLWPHWFISQPTVDIKMH